MTKGECQVINLGAGSDTWYWNLVDEQRSPKRAWVEVDFSEITAKTVSYTHLTLPTKRIV